MADEPPKMLAVIEQGVCDSVHDALIKLIAAIADFDPPADTPEGKLLNGLIDAVEAYESVRWPEWNEAKAAADALGRARAGRRIPRLRVRFEREQEEQ